ncbi:uncharacterized protein At2g29880-like [Tasmannia lanceolata]|uniref:uncharacterized protein At2g29880-like n=1 Tax=Tasmannia lanceolata TaxID=3420 RepID=UPI0040648D26
MASSSGFGWDPFTKNITAPEEVWDAYIVAHPEAASYRVKAVEEFEELKTILGNGFAVGSNAAQVSEAGVDIGADLDDIVFDDNIGNGGDDFLDHAPSQAPATNSTMQRKRRYEEQNSSRQRARPTIDTNEVLVESFTNLVSEMKALNPKNAAHANCTRSQT